MDRAKKIIEFLKEYFDGERIQMFYTRNTVGDWMYTIYSDDGITIDYCSGWLYIEIFGLTDEEFNSVMEAIGY